MGSKSDSPNTSKLPEWKQYLTSKPSISVRQGIANLYDQPFEDTSTLVLTAPSGQFIDIRLPLQSFTDPPDATTPLSTHPSFWAFSGTSTTSFYDETDDHEGGAVSLPYTAHTVFTHEIDTKGPGITDEGDCFLLPNGNVMEVGVWSDTNQMYKEYWTEPEIMPGRSELMKKPMVVAKTVESRTGRGIVIRIGDYLQAIFEFYEDEVGREKIVIQRLTRSFDPHTSKQNSEEAVSTTEDGDSSTLHNESSQWQLDDGIDDGHWETFPSDMILLDEAALGKEFEVGGNRWRVTEFDA